jgi:RHS repeat-associated protein
LHTAAASGTLGVDGAYNLETYDYDDQGRLMGLPTLGSYDYSGAHPHAVEKINGSQKYWYDANGNMTRRDVGNSTPNTFNLTYDAENHLTGVSGTASNTYLYDGDGQRVKETSYENLAAGLPFTSDTTLYWPEVPSDGDIWADSGVGANGEFAYTAGTGLHYVQLDLGTTYNVDKLKIFHYAADGRTYHQNKTQVSADGVSWTTVFDSAVSGEYAETSAGHTLSFSARSVRYMRDYLNGSTSNSGDHWVEIEAYGSRTVAHIGNYYDWDANASTPTKYYYAGAERLAMRTGTGTGTTGLKWLLDDQLGSTAITADGATGAKLSELRYKPWGEIRYASQPTMTERRYTGQRMEGIGLYDYGARWFDPYLNRWIQPDTIIPDPYNPQDWDRYAYVRNNPVINVDPTGHMLDQGGGASSMGNKFWENRQKKLDFLNKKEKDIRPSFVPLNTATPTGPTYNAAPSVTPDTTLNQNGNADSEGINIRIQVNVDWSKVDKVDVIIDTGGILGDLALLAQPEGDVPYIISEAAEGLGFLKSLSDISNGDTSNMYMHQMTSTTEKAVVLFFRAERLVPLVGFAGNLVSLGMNLRPEFSISIKP